ncbi:unnamed protein product [Cylicostephanus goldi]|uniref:Uncharacterized protein n=1 Tax=Cylicostephanus goldi TaxID=71465 RepID=A0A3P7MD25_CYLGO|nr:unnamed protein product [Cylicostephanus goldi]
MEVDERPTSKKCGYSMNKSSSPQWDPENNTSLSPSEASSRAFSPATRGGLSRKIEAITCNLENVREAKATEESNRRRAAEGFELPCSKYSTIKQ